jgi:hypothetical protein
MNVKKEKITKIILLSFGLILLLSPTVNFITTFPKIKSLDGWVVLHEHKKISVKDWFSGNWQEEEELFLNDNFGFRPFFVRLNNQIVYTFFGKAKAAGVIFGKNNYLYEKNYIDAYYGTDFIGEDSIQNRMFMLKKIQDTLSKHNKDIILIFAQGKGSFYPEFIPNVYRTDKKQTNYDIYIQYANQLNINYIDFNKYFVENRYKAKYPLYPQYGIHWSIYGSIIAGDSIIHYIEAKRQIDMPQLLYDKVVISQPKSNDYDIGNGINILFHLRSFDMGYPEVYFEPADAKVRPSLLVISDSFYWLLAAYGFQDAFANTSFWFYNKEIYPQIDNQTANPKEINLAQEIEKYDVILIISTDANLPNLGWGFIERCYEIFKQ